MDNAGLLFLKRGDPYSRLWMQITRQRYSHIGFYYMDEGLDGTAETVVLICDLYHSSSSKWINTYPLSTLINDPLMEEMLARPLIQNEEGNRLDNLKAAIGNILLTAQSNIDMSAESVDMNKIIYQLFGVVDPGNEISTVPVSSVELVNLIFKNLNDWEVFNVVSEGSEQETIGLFSVINTMPIHNPDTTYRNIRYYLGESIFFGPLYRIELNQTTYKLQAYQSASLSQKSFISSVINTLIAKLNDDPKFSENISLYTKQIEAGSQDRLSRLEQLVVQLCQSHKSWLQLYNQMITTNIMAVNQVVEIQDWVWQSLNVLLKDDRIIEEMAYQIPPVSSGLISIVPSTGREVRANPNYVITQLTEQVRQMVETLNRGETPLLDINQLIQSVNFLNMAMGSTTEPIATLSTGNDINTKIRPNVNIIGVINSDGRAIIPPQSHLIFSTDTPYSLDGLSPEVISFLKNHLSKEVSGPPTLFKFIASLQ